MQFFFIILCLVFGLSGRGVVHNPYHLPNYYAPYNPVSRQDSEISSDCHTDDTRSLTDSSV